MSNVNPKIAIVYDWIDKWGGVERVLLTLHEMFPQAVFYTSYFDQEGAWWAEGLNIKTSFIQKFPGFIKKSRLLSLLLYPLAFEAFDFSAYDAVISVTSSFAKGIITKPQTKHICYLLTPTRYIWGQKKAYINNPLSELGNAFIGKYLEQWDYIAARRVDSMVSISQLIQERCKKYYKKDSKVIYPPFDEEYWENVKNKLEKEKPPEKFFLVVSRLEPYKNVDLVIQAFNDIPDKKLIIVGTGTKEHHLHQIAHKNILFLKNITDRELGALYSHAEALIMPQEEDFGYVALEAQFFGCPVISYIKSGAKETVVAGKTGLFFPEQTVDSLRKTLAEFDIISKKLKESCLKEGPKHVQAFSKNKFKQLFTISKL